MLKNCVPINRKRAVSPFKHQLVYAADEVCLIAPYFESCTKHINTISGKENVIWNAKIWGMYSKNCVLEG
jgi:hypothetical protein